MHFSNFFYCCQKRRNPLALIIWRLCVCVFWREGICNNNRKFHKFYWPSKKKRWEREWQRWKFWFESIFPGKNTLLKKWTETPTQLFLAGKLFSLKEKLIRIHTKAKPRDACLGNLKAFFINNILCGGFVLKINQMKVKQKKKKRKIFKG